MPCYTIRTATVEFRVQSKEILLEVLKRNNIRIYSDSGNYIKTSYGDFDLEKGEVKTSSNAYQINKLKRGYSAVVIEEVAKKKKWFVKKQSENKNKITLRRL